MEKYLALLRGINVGGKNIIKMAELQSLFSALGFAAVFTYINSGNIIFATTCTDEKALQAKCEKALQEKWNSEIPVFIMAANHLTAALKNAPVWWGQDITAKHNAIFTFAPLTAEAFMKEVGHNEYEQYYCYKNIVFWSAAAKDFAKTKLSRIPGTALYQQITVRNSRTTYKLQQLASGV